MYAEGLDGFRCSVILLMPKFCFGLYSAVESKFTPGLLFSIQIFCFRWARPGRASHDGIHEGDPNILQPEGIEGNLYVKLD